MKIRSNVANYAFLFFLVTITYDISVELNGKQSIKQKMKDISSRSERTGLLLKVTLGHFLADYTITHFLYILNLKNKHVKNPIQDTNTSTP